MLVTPNCGATCVREAGAIMEEDKGDMKVKAETMAVEAHFFLNDQL